MEGNGAGILQTDRVVLRPVDTGDLDYLYRASVGGQSSFRWRFHGSTPSRDQFLSSLWNGVTAQFMVTNIRGEVAGLVVGYNFDLRNQYGWMAMMIDDDHQGLLWPQEAGALFIGYCFTNWNLRKIYFEVPEYNLPNIGRGLARVAQEEARFVQHSYFAGRYWDQTVFALYRSTWEEGRFSHRFGRQSVPHPDGLGA